MAEKHRLGLAADSRRKRSVVACEAVFDFVAQADEEVEVRAHQVSRVRPALANLPSKLPLLRLAVDPFKAARVVPLSIAVDVGSR